MWTMRHHLERVRPAWRHYRPLLVNACLQVIAVNMVVALAIGWLLSGLGTLFVAVRRLWSRSAFAVRPRRRPPAMTGAGGAIGPRLGRGAGGFGMRRHPQHSRLGSALVEALMVGLIAVIAAFLTYVQRHTLRVFAYYRIMLGVVVLLVFH